MKIAMVASEAAPFVKTGGLGDVMQALPAELSKIKGNEIALFLPYYKKIKHDSNIEVESLGSFYMELSWRESYVGIFRLKTRRKKLQVYFIDNEYYFAVFPGFQARHSSLPRLAGGYEHYLLPGALRRLVPRYQDRLYHPQRGIPGMGGYVLL